MFSTFTSDLNTGLVLITGILLRKLTLPECGVEVAQVIFRITVMACHVGLLGSLLQLVVLGLLVFAIWSDRSFDASWYLK